uniref:Uncharacterized protein n=1 Tax=Desertifilum tharense IPPAS B-1220 TaxID=1781255 RepID=A0ACD5GS16_9CYAN
MSEQIEKIKQLIKTATNSKQKAMYQDLLVKLESESDELPPPLQNRHRLQNLY